MTGHDRVLLITGATGGIGSATARMARAEGWRTVLVARSAAVTDLAEELGGESKARAIAADTTDMPSLQRAVDLAVVNFGALDAVFINAGVSAGPRQYTPSLIGESTDGWREMVLTNILGTAVAVRAAIPALIASRGRLVITGSVLGRYAMPSSFYSATKYAVAGIAETVRLELLGTGVGVTLLEPGPVATSFADATPPATDSPSLKTDDVARMVMFALSQPPGVDLNELLVRPHGATP